MRTLGYKDCGHNKRIPRIACSVVMTPAGFGMEDGQSLFSTCPNFVRKCGLDLCLGIKAGVLI